MGRSKAPGKEPQNPPPTAPGSARTKRARAPSSTSNGSPERPARTGLLRTRASDSTLRKTRRLPPTPTRAPSIVVAEPGMAQASSGAHALAPVSEDDADDQPAVGHDKHGVERPLHKGHLEDSEER